MGCGCSKKSQKGVVEPLQKDEFAPVKNVDGTITQSDMPNEEDSNILAINKKVADMKLESVSTPRSAASAASVGEPPNTPGTGAGLPGAVDSPRDESKKEAKKRLKEEAAARKKAEKASKARAKAMEKSQKEAIAMMKKQEALSKAREAEEAEAERLIKEEYEKMKALEEQRRIERLTKEAVEKDIADAANPDLASFRVIFLRAGGSRKIYRFHLPKETGTIAELKTSINLDFGYAIGQQHIYYNFKEVGDGHVITTLDDWSDGSVLHFAPDGSPAVTPERIYRPLQPELDIMEIMLANSTTDEVPAGTADNIDEATALPKYRNWCSEAADLASRPINTPQEAINREIEIKQQQEEFVSAAKRAVAKILDGSLSPVPIPEVFGIGGEKYVSGGILLRKVSKWEVGGENIGEGDSAFKAGAHELKMLNLLRDLVPGVTSPLAALVDSFGIRFLALSFVAIDHTTLKYGSSTNGLKIVSTDGAAAYASKIGGALNLLPHSVTDTATDSAEKHDLATPYTLEIHSATLPETSYVALNAGRLMPPDLSQELVDPIEAVTKMLRPELVTGWGSGQVLREGFIQYETETPIVCDACEKVINEYEFWSYEKKEADVCCECYESNDRRIPFMRSKFKHTTVPEDERVTYWKHSETGEVSFEKPIVLTPLNPDASTEDDRAAIKEAASFLDTKIIPEFVKELEEADDTYVLTSTQLRDAMHERGINMRYLGKVASSTKLNHIRELATREMLARCAKVLIRDGLSFLPSFNEKDAKAVIVHYLNQLFTTKESEQSLTVWRYMEELTFKKFGHSLEEKVTDKIYKLGLVHAISEQVGFTLSSYSEYDFDEEAPFGLDSVTQLITQVKISDFNSQLIERALLTAREKDSIGKRSVWHLDGGPERAEATVLYREAIDLALNIHGGETDKQIADIYFEFAEHLQSRHAEKGRPEYSRWNRCSGVPGNELSEESLQYYQKSINVRKELRGHEMDLDIAEAWVGIARVVKPVDESRSETIDALSKAVEITQTVLGFNHPETAEKYSWLALNYSDMGETEKASEFIRKAFIIVHSIFGDEHVIISQTHDFLKAIEMRANSGLEDVPIGELSSRIEKLLLGEGDSSSDEDDDGEDAEDDDSDF